MLLTDCHIKKTLFVCQNPPKKPDSWSAHHIDLHIGRKWLLRSRSVNNESNVGFKPAAFIIFRLKTIKPAIMDCVFSGVKFLSAEWHFCIRGNDLCMFCMLWGFSLLSVFICESKPGQRELIPNKSGH